MLERLLFGRYCRGARSELRRSLIREQQDLNKSIEEALTPGPREASVNKFEGWTANEIVTASTSFWASEDKSVRVDRIGAETKPTSWVAILAVLSVFVVFITNSVPTNTPWILSSVVGFGLGLAVTALGAYRVLRSAKTKDVDPVNTLRR